MFHINVSLLSKTKALESNIDQFHDKLIDVSLTFNKVINTYLKSMHNSDFEKYSKQVKKIEHDADGLRRDIEKRLYSHNLLPDLRADVLKLIENLDKVINKFEEVTYMFYAQNPEIPDEYITSFKELGKLSAECAESMCKASRAYFRDLTTMRDYAQKVYFLEHESDTCSRKLTEEIFASPRSLAEKIQLHQFVEGIADIADKAEDFIDLLLIFAIKRDI